MTAKGRSVLPSGTRLGPYEILAPLGAGGMGDVYRARDTRLGRDVALKTLPPEFAADSERLSRFDLEARAVSALNDPHVVAIYDVGVHEGTPFVVFELVEGDTLRKRIEQGALPFATALDLATQVARGLAAAHERGIVHRDLKPENIVVARDGRVKILDFGLAKRMAGERTGSDTATIGAALTSPGSVYGTIGYMAPEQIREQTVDGRTDLFALGGILYEMLSGHRAFSGATPADVQTAILSMEPDPLPEAPLRLPGLDRVVRRALEKDPSARPQHARDFAFDLELLASAGLAEAAGKPAKRRSNRGAIFTAASLGMVAALALAWVLARTGSKAGHVSYQRVTFRSGVVHDARFTPDGHTVVYSAQWGGDSAEVYTAQVGSPETRSLGYRNAVLLAISSAGDLGIGTHTTNRPHLTRLGTLARVPLAGGAPRAIVDSVVAADWARDGTLAVLIASAGRYRLEWPPGHVLRETPGWMSHPRIAPSGDQIAVFDHSIFPDDRGTLMVLDRKGGAKVLGPTFGSCQGIAWRPDGTEIWFSAARSGQGAEIYAAKLDGAMRTVAESPGGMRITDIASDGRVLFVRDNRRAELHALGPDATGERELTWGDWSVPADLSADGRTVLFTEEGDAVLDGYIVCIRGTDGSPVVKLGNGSAAALSPDGRYALATTLDTPTELTVLPTGAGQARTLPRGPIRTHYHAVWLPDGRRVFAMGEDSAGAVKGYIQDVVGGDPRPVLEGVDFTAGPIQITPDGRYAAVSPLRKLYSLTGGPAVGIPGVTPSERFFCVGFGPGGHEIFAAPIGSPRPTVVAIDLKTGRRRTLRIISPQNPAGVLSAILWRFNQDGRSFVYGLDRNLSEVYIAKGLR